MNLKRLLLAAGFGVAAAVVILLAILVDALARSSVAALVSGVPCLVLGMLLGHLFMGQRPLASPAVLRGQWRHEFPSRWRLATFSPGDAAQPRPPPLDGAAVLYFPEGAYQMASEVAALIGKGSIVLLPNTRDRRGEREWDFRVEVGDRGQVSVRNIDTLMPRVQRSNEGGRRAPSTDRMRRDILTLDPGDDPSGRMPAGPSAKPPGRA